MDYRDQPEQLNRPLLIIKNIKREFGANPHERTPIYFMHSSRFNLQGLEKKTINSSQDKSDLFVCLFVFIVLYFLVLVLLLVHKGIGLFG